MHTYVAKIKENGLLSVCNAMKSVKPYPYQRLTGLIKLFLQITLIRVFSGLTYKNTRAFLNIKHNSVNLRTAIASSTVRA